jgi:SAM-dependent methyltransferase
MAHDRYQTSEYIEKNPTYHVEDSAFKARHILRMLKKHHLGPRRVCEVGCGAGEVLRQLQLQLPPVTEFHGYEVSPYAFELCRGRANEHLHYHCEDLLSVETDPFDLMLCLDVFEHVEDYMGFLRKLRLRAAYTIFHIPLEMTVQWVWRCRPLLEERARVGHLHHFMKETALATLADTGYELIDSFYTAGAVEKPDSIKATMAIFPRRLSYALNEDLAARVLGGYSLLALTR